MRITNKIMQSNTLYNINNNKILQDKLNTQITTKKTVTRPSDDPVIAIRSLRLRTNLDQVTQYYKKNIPDAQNWLDLTEKAIDNTVKVISDMIDQFQRGSKGSLKTSDRAIIIDALKELRNEVYATGDADCAGRGLFTGYRTDYKLTFQRDTKQEYTITEQLNSLNVETFLHVNSDKVKCLNEANFDDDGTVAGTKDMRIDPNNINSVEIDRLQLGYGNLKYDATATPAVGLPVITQTIGYDADGNPQTVPLINPADIQVIHRKDDPTSAAQDPYLSVPATGKGAVFIPETGELLLSKETADDLRNLDPNTPINITYLKEDWSKGDLMPEHYFACESNGIKYNEDYLTEKGKTEKQVIAYDVGFNQTLDVNTTADEIYYHGINRTVDEMIALLQDMNSIDTAVEKLEAMEGNAAYDQDKVREQLENAKKAQTYMKDCLQKRMEHGITIMQGYLDKANLALTNCGNRGARLDLVENRLSNQQASFTELTSKNDDADLAELAVQLSSAELTYNAALAATGKLLQTTLLNYI